MYIEMTPFAIPTFLIVIAKAAALMAAAFVVLAVIVGFFYPSN